MDLEFHLNNLAKPRLPTKIVETYSTEMHCDK